MHPYTTNYENIRMKMGTISAFKAVKWYLQCTCNYLWWLSCFAFEETHYSLLMFFIFLLVCNAFCCLRPSMLNKTIERLTAWANKSQFISMKCSRGESDCLIWNAEAIYREIQCKEKIDFGKKLTQWKIDTCPTEPNFKLRSIPYQKF